MLVALLAVLIMLVVLAYSVDERTRKNLLRLLLLLAGCAALVIMRLMN